MSTSIRRPSTMNLARSVPSVTNPAERATAPDAGLLTRCPSSRRSRPPSLSAQSATVAAAAHPAAPAGRGRHPVPEPAVAVLLVHADAHESRDPVRRRHGPRAMRRPGRHEVLHVPLGVGRRVTSPCRTMSRFDRKAASTRPASSRRSGRSHTPSSLVIPRAVIAPRYRRVRRPPGEGRIGRSLAGAARGAPDRRIRRSLVGAAPRCRRCRSLPPTPAPPIRRPSGRSGNCAGQLSAAPRETGQRPRCAAQRRDASAAASAISASISALRRTGNDT